MSLLNPHSWSVGAYDVAFVCSCGVFLVPVGLLLVQRLRGRLTPSVVRWNLAVSALLLLSLNPFFQLLVLGPVDDTLRSRWRARAEEQHLVGMSAEDVLGLFGEPCEKRDETPGVCGPGGCRSAAAPYTAWDYSPLPVYWFSHAFHFKVFFENGRATGFRKGG